MIAYISIKCKYFFIFFCIVICIAIYDTDSMTNGPKRKDLCYTRSLSQ